jgi:hypothetical protein
MLSNRSFRRRALALPLLVLAASLLAGCPDPNGSFESFVEKAEAIPSGPLGQCGETVQTVEGDFFFALSAQLAPTKPIVFLTQITTDAGGMSFHIQALSAEDRTTPVGDGIDIGPYPIDAEGTFVAALPPLAVVGAANPITGSDIEATITLKGSVCADFLCGSVEGAVTKVNGAPSDIVLTADKSFFTMALVTTPGDYPEPPQIDCAGKLAKPLPL